MNTAELQTTIAQLLVAQQQLVAGLQAQIPAQPNSPLSKEEIAARRLAGFGALKGNVWMADDFIAVS